MFVGPRGRNEKSVRVTQGIHRAGNVCKCLVHGWRSFDFLFCCFEAGIDIQPFVLFVVVILFYVVANSVQHFFRHSTIFTAQGLILSQRYPPGRKKKNEQYSAALAYASQSVVGSHLRHIVARPRSTALRFLFFPFEEQNQTPAQDVILRARAFSSGRSACPERGRGDLARSPSRRPPTRVEPGPA